MKEGLLAYIDEDKRSITTMVSLKRKCDQRNQAPSQGVWTVRFDRAYLLQAILDGSRRDSRVALPRCRGSRRRLLSILSMHPDLKIMVWAKWVRDLFSQH